MPYIKEEKRRELNPHIQDLAKALLSAGDLNFTITRLIHEWVKTHGECYDTYNSVMGALECAKQELYRRKIAPYEDKKIKENGDV